ncbi:spectrin beta chain-like isoform X4 [Eriocheir sinensis]|uniref:spectrin beta chain-like isoform X4 n=1 Tax=Eriocheir sinensis TaxID=95602 RepID=UPI0021CA63E6|nr:spectrin beta chain-like isoform X4 [Eriocheir sinensis]
MTLGLQFELKELKRKQEEEEEERRRQEELARQAAAPPPQSPDQPTDGVDGSGEDSHLNGDEHDESREAPTPASKESRRRVRSRSKSPFRSFRWKKTKTSPSEAPGSASDDESNLERAAAPKHPPSVAPSTTATSAVAPSAPAPAKEERPSPTGDEDLVEGSLVRKHEWESTTKKASNRSWDKLYLVLRGNMLFCYKDRKSYQAAPEVYFRAEGPCDLSGGQASVADDYTKKKHVLRLRLVGGSEYLFQAKDEEELNMWVSALQVATSSEGSAGPSRSQTLPAGSEKKDEPKRRSFFTLKKK